MQLFRSVRNWASRLRIVVTGCLFALSASVAPANSSPAAAVVPANVPLRVVLERRVPIKRVGEPIQGQLLAPVYVYDRMVLPAGSRIEGHIVDIEAVPLHTRLEALLSGNLTPRRKASAQFDVIVLRDGSRIALQTAPSRGSAQALVVAKHGHGDSGSQAANTQSNREGFPAAIRALQAPGKLARLRESLLSRFPYHRQAWAAGTIFSGTLRQPVTVPASSAEEHADLSPLQNSEDQPVSARLLTAISSASARRGMPVEAVVTRPHFSADHSLLIPEGARLIGEVTDAKPARRWHRNGKLLFVFHRVELSPAAQQNIQGYLESAQADVSSHLAIDAEGQARITNPKSRFIFPALATVVAGLSVHQDYNSQGVPDQDIGGRAESGAVGLGLIGTAVAQISRTVASGIAFTGAGYSIYSTFITRGHDVQLAANTPIEVSIQRARKTTVKHR